MNKQNVITRNITILLDEAPLNFDEIFSITDPNAAKKAIEVSRLFQKALVPVEGDSLRFDVKRAIELADSTPGLAVVNYMDQAIETHSQKTSVMVDKVINSINKVLGIKLSPRAEKKLEGAIESAYVDLNERKDSAWVFWERKEAHKTTYQYNITFGIQNDETGLFLYSLPMGLTINVSKEYERVLFITITDTESYVCRVQSLSAVCLYDDTIKAHQENKFLEKIVSEGPKELTREELGLSRVPPVTV